MNFVYYLQGVEFEWDTNKAQINVEKHGVTLDYRILFVVYVERNQRTRIISARPATRMEKKQYEQT